VITAKDSAPLRQRMKELKSNIFFPGCHNKAEAFDELVVRLGVNPDKVAYVGDDVIDLQVMPKVGSGNVPIRMRMFCSAPLLSRA